MLGPWRILNWIVNIYGILCCFYTAFSENKFLKRIIFREEQAQLIAHAPNKEISYAVKFLIVRQSVKDKGKETVRNISNFRRYLMLELHGCV